MVDKVGKIATLIRTQLEITSLWTVQASAMQMEMPIAQNKGLIITHKEEEEDEEMYRCSAA